MFAYYFLYLHTFTSVCNDNTLLEVTKLYKSRVFSLVFFLSLEGSRSVQIFADPDPDPGGPITWGIFGSGILGN